MSGDRVRPDYLFLHVVTSRISEMECYAVATVTKWECVIRRKSLMSGGVRPSRSMRRFSTVETASVVAAVWSRRHGGL